MLAEIACLFMKCFRPICQVFFRLSFALQILVTFLILGQGHDEELLKTVRTIANCNFSNTFRVVYIEMYSQTYNYDFLS